MMETNNYFVCCKDCIYWQSAVTSGKIGECRKRAPQKVDPIYNEVFPTTKADWWCGESIPRPK